MFSFDRQRATQAALRQLDDAMTKNADILEKLQKHTIDFRDQLYAAYQFIERESLQSRTLLVQTNRVEANLLQVQVRGRPAMDLFVDSEVAYDQRVADQGKPELATRLFALFGPPQRGLLRHYTIFISGEWKRTVFVSRGGKVQALSSLRSEINPDILLDEATDLLGQLCSVYPTWNPLNDDPNSVGREQVRDRSFSKRDPLGLG
jgi:hypothetical protein